MGNSASTDEFILACQSNDLVKMKKQIKLKIDVNSENGLGNGLHNSCAQVLFILYFLTDCFSLPCLLPSFHPSFLPIFFPSSFVTHFDYSQGHLEAVNLLLSSKVNVNSVDARGDSPLIISVRGTVATYPRAHSFTHVSTLAH